MSSRARQSAFRAVALFTALLLPLTSFAGVIRDAEIEHALYTYSRPIFLSAGIEPNSVRILVVDNPEVNAYVAGGLNIFINTGLIRVATKPGMLIGVIAHETGHIAGAHLSQYREKSSRAVLGGLIGAVIGAGVAVAGGGNAGAGVIAASQSMAQRQLMGDIRLNEQSADHAALGYLDDNDISATGMLAMFEALHQRELGGTAQDKFLTDHPLSTERIATMRNHVNESSIPKGQLPKEYDVMHARMLAKLIAFTESYDTTLTLYPSSDASIAGRYARAIAEFKRNHYDAALEGMNGLIKQFPKDPFFYDTLGQIQFESGKVTEAAATYAKASTYAPDSALIKTDYARALIALDRPTKISQAIDILDKSKELDDSYAMTWRQLSIAYGKQGRLGKSYAALAEEAALNGDSDSVLQHVARARAYMKEEPSLRVELDDLERDAKAQRKKKKDEDSPF